MDDQAYCEMFYAAHYLPVAVYAGGSFLCSAGFYVEGDPYPFVLPKLMEMGSFDGADAAWRQRQAAASAYIEPALDEAIFLKEGRIFAHRTVDEIRETEGKSVDEYFREVFKC